ncbi:MAG: hypothetical protein WB660_29330, partial [Candidatus Sulfotelmatobacter sp.]
MNLVGPRFKLGVVAIFVFFAARQGLATVAVPVADPTGPAFCVAPKYRELDFWVGDWDAFDVENPAVKVAHNRVDRILDG